MSSKTRSSRVIAPSGNLSLTIRPMMAFLLLVGLPQHTSASARRPPSAPEEPALTQQGIDLLEFAGIIADEKWRMYRGLEVYYKSRDPSKNGWYPARYIEVDTKRTDIARQEGWIRVEYLDTFLDMPGKKASIRCDGSLIRYPDALNASRIASMYESTGATEEHREQARREEEQQRIDLAIRLSMQGASGRAGMHESVPDQESNDDVNRNDEQRLIRDATRPEEIPRESNPDAKPSGKVMKTKADELYATLRNAASSHVLSSYTELPRTQNVRRYIRPRQYIRMNLQNIKYLEERVWEILRLVDELLARDTSSDGAHKLYFTLYVLSNFFQDSGRKDFKVTPECHVWEAIFLHLDITCCVWRHQLLDPQMNWTLDWTPKSQRPYMFIDRLRQLTVMWPEWFAYYHEHGNLERDIDQRNFKKQFASRVAPQPSASKDSEPLGKQLENFIAKCADEGVYDKCFYEALELQEELGKCKQSNGQDRRVVVEQKIRKLLNDRPQTPPARKDVTFLDPAQAEAYDHDPRSESDNESSDDKPERHKVSKGSALPEDCKESDLVEFTKQSPDDLRLDHQLACWEQALEHVQSAQLPLLDQYLHELPKDLVSHKDFATAGRLKEQILIVISSDDTIKNKFSRLQKAMLDTNDFLRRASEKLPTINGIQALHFSKEARRQRVNKSSDDEQKMHEVSKGSALPEDCKESDRAEHTSKQSPDDLRLDHQLACWDQSLELVQSAQLALLDKYLHELPKDLVSHEDLATAGRLKEQILIVIGSYDTIENKISRLQKAMFNANDFFRRARNELPLQYAGMF